MTPTQILEAVAARYKAKKAKQAEQAQEKIKAA